MHIRIPRSSLVLIAACALALGCDDNGIEDDEFVATLSGANEVPANDSDATGSFFMEDDGDDLEFRLRVEDIISPTMAHIHAGAPGVNGGILVTLFNTTTPPATFDGILATGEFDGSDIMPLPGAAAAISLDSLRVLLRTNGAYVNVHTLAIPAGEIRGQIVVD